MNRIDNFLFRFWGEVGRVHQLREPSTFYAPSLKLFYPVAVPNRLSHFNACFFVYPKFFTNFGQGQSLLKQNILHNGTCVRRRSDASLRVHVHSPRGRTRMRVLSGTCARSISVTGIAINVLWYTCTYSSMYTRVCNVQYCNSCSDRYGRPVPHLFFLFIVVYWYCNSSRFRISETSKPHDTMADLATVNTTAVCVLRSVPVVLWYLCPVYYTRVHIHTQGRARRPVLSILQYILQYHYSMVLQ